MRYGLGFKADMVAAALAGDPILSGEVNYRVVIPPDYSSVISVCTALEYLGAFQEAGLVYETVIGATEHPELRSFLYYLLGCMRMAEGERESALSHLRNSVVLMGKGWPFARPGDYARLGESLLRLDLRSESVTVLRRGLAVDPSDQAARVLLGRSLYLGGDSVLAINEYEEALKLGSTSICEFNMALAYLSLGEIGQAERIYADAFARYGRTEAERVGALLDLRALAKRGVEPDAIRQVTARYWP